MRPRSGGRAVPPASSRRWLRPLAPALGWLRPPRRAWVVWRQAAAWAAWCALWGACPLPGAVLNGLP
eukprot:11927097-Alexandrium_andersonii.AAC.1